MKGNFIKIINVLDYISPNLILLDIIPSTGLLIKYDPSIAFIYIGFGLLMLTGSLSYLPYTQIWLFDQKISTKNSIIWIGSLTNRGKIQLEIEFENLLRYIENTLLKISKSIIKS
jgi:cytochrome c biogenesis protein